jgi:hypothetical protein
VVLRILAKACENEICVPDLSCMPWRKSKWTSKLPHAKTC